MVTHACATYVAPATWCCSHTVERHPSMDPPTAEERDDIIVLLHSCIICMLLPLIACSSAQQSCFYIPAFPSRATISVTTTANSCERALDMGRIVKVAATQFQIHRNDVDKNLDKAEKLVWAAAADGANVIVLPELFEHWYFAQEQNQEFFEWARPVSDSKAVHRMSALAKELGVVLPVSFWERSNNGYYNSLAMIDADGTNLGVYRKSHIPDSPGYQEKFYSVPGDTGFKVWDTKFGRIGAAVCWDQWFPEAARVMALKGAELLLYPTAIGTSPTDPTYSKYPHWTRTLAGHAAANMVPLVASNRVGTEKFSTSQVTYYGGIIIIGQHGEVMKQLGATRPGNILSGVLGIGAGTNSGLLDGHFDLTPDRVEGHVVQEFDLDQCRMNRAGYALFRDRRPELYAALLTMDGITRPPFGVNTGLVV